jgi:hypothetical protein
MANTAGDHQGEHERGEREQDVEHPGDHRVHPAAEVRRGDPEQAADHDADDGDRQADLECHLAAGHELGEDIDALHVGAKQVPRRQRGLVVVEDVTRG